MKRRLAAGGFAAVLAVATFASTALAAAPANPGCFGTDRAGNLTTWIMDLPNPGASWWGHEAASRADGNGQSNQGYKIFCGGSPSTP
jgi:hypothetical protein